MMKELNYNQQALLDYLMEDEWDKYKHKTPFEILWCLGNLASGFTPFSLSSMDEKQQMQVLQMYLDIRREKITPKTYQGSCLETELRKDYVEVIKKRGITPDLEDKFWNEVYGHHLGIDLQKLGFIYMVDKCIWIAIDENGMEWRYVQK